MRSITSIIGLAALCGAAHAQTAVWQNSGAPLGVDFNPLVQQLLEYSNFQANPIALRQMLESAPREVPTNPKIGQIVLLPAPDGSLRKFRLAESPIQSPEVERMTGVKTYAAQGVDDPWAYGRFDLGINGFHGLVLSPHGDYFIWPLNQGDLVNHLVFFKKDMIRLGGFECGVKATDTRKSSFGGAIPPPMQRPGTNRKEYRLALKGTGEYTAVFGSQTNANNNSTTIMNLVAAPYIVDIAIQMNIVNMFNYTNGATDPYTNNNGVAMLNENQVVCDANPGNAAYDIGHVFSTGGGGVAVLQCVGVTGQKAKGVTGLPNPTGTVFAIDFVAHEMGHQFGARHTFNGTTGNCGGGNRSSTTAYEPGSGSTIMAYAGICGAEDIQPNSDAYFHTISQAEIEAWRNNVGSGGTAVNTGNISPVVNAGADFTIPQDTPFRLTATASDGNGDPLTYCWEQFNLGAATPPVNEASSPLFRSLMPSTSPTRWFPKQTTVINNIFDQWENLPSVNRVMTFRCTVRDNRAGGGNFEWDAMNVTVSGTPFAVTAPNTNVSWTGGSNQTVTWNVGGGSVAANVRILLSTNGGNSFFTNTATVVLATTPNDGSQAITVPNVNSTQCRIIVEAIGNIFYDMSNVNFTIVPGTQTVNPSSFVINSGTQLGGTLSSLFTSDNDHLAILCDDFDPQGNVEVFATSPLSAVSQVQFIFETRSTRNDITEFVDMFNYQTNAYELVNSRTMTTTDSTVTKTFTTNAIRFIQSGTLNMKSRFRFVPQQDIIAFDGWSYLIDRAVWTVTP